MSLLKLVKLNNTNKALELLQGTPDLSQINPSDGRTVFHYAVENSNQEILSALLSHIQNSENTDNSLEHILFKEDLYGHTALMLSIHDNNPPCFDLLLKFTKEIDYKATNNARTALHYAAEANTPIYIEKLLEQKANINAYCSEGTPLHLAIKCNNTENVLCLLERTEISFVESDQKGNTPLHLAVIEGNYEIFFEILKKVLLCPKEKAQDILNIRNLIGNTILHEAVAYKRSSFIDLLKKKAEGLLNQEICNKAGKKASDIQKQLEENEEKERLEVLERKKLNNLRNKEKQEVKKRELLENEKKMKEEETNLMKQKEEAAAKPDDKKGTIISFLILVCVFVVMYLALNGLAERKRENYLD